MKHLFALFLTILVSLLPTAQTNPANRPLVLIHVTVIDMTGAPPKSDQTVIITGNRIAVVGKASEVSLAAKFQGHRCNWKVSDPRFVGYALLETVYARFRIARITKTRYKTGCARSRSSLNVP